MNQQNQQTLPIKLNTVLLADTETTGLKEGPNARLVEIGAVWWDIDHGITLAAWSELVEGPSNEAAGVNKIPQTALRYGLTRDQALEGLRSRASRADVVVCHRADFDSFFLGDLGRPYVCSKFSFEWPGVDLGSSLLYTAAGLGVPIVEQHRALTDCFLLAKCLERVHAKEGPAGIRARFARAMRPAATFRAIVSYDDRDLAKKAGFQWQPEKKWWVRERLAIEDAALLPFKTERV
jgi:DNA polymerase-3 subunit epsilon